MAKPKLRHIAISVQDPEATAKFYEETFGLERIYKSAFGVMMSDGVVSLAVLSFTILQVVWIRMARLLSC